MRAPLRCRPGDLAFVVANCEFIGSVVRVIAFGLDGAWSTDPVKVVSMGQWAGSVAHFTDGALRPIRPGADDLETETVRDIIEEQTA